jgi:hypothetical protein
MRASARAAQQGGFVRAGDSGIDIQHLRPGQHLLAGVFEGFAEIACGHRRSQFLTSGGVDTFADDHEGVARPNNDFLVVQGEDGFHQIRLLPGIWPG